MRPTPAHRRPASVVKTLTAAVTALVVGGCAPPAARPAELFSHGEDRGLGNLLGVQAYMTPDDYRTRDTFAARLGGWLDEAAAEGLLGPSTIVVFPEYVGAWLVAVDEGEATYRAPSTTLAMVPLIARHAPDFAARHGAATTDDKETYAAFATKSARMAEVYVDVFSSLARAHAVTVVAGAILLTGPRVDDGVLTVDEDGPLENVSLVFGPDGEIKALVEKSFPTESEQGFLTAAPPERLPVVDTPAGRLGVLICADAWYPPAYRALDEQGVDLVVVPSFVHGDDTWAADWGGYSGHDAPDDVDPDDIGALTEGEAWARYALPGRIKSTSARAGLIVNLRGDLWDLGASGAALLAHDGDTVAAPDVDGALLVNLWL